MKTKPNVFVRSALLACALGQISHFAVAQVEDEASSSVCFELPEELKTNVYFGNGVRTESGNAYETREELRNVYESRLNALRDSSEDFKDEKYTFKVAYNPTVSTLSDTSEVLVQKAIELGADPEAVEDFTGIGLLYMAFLTESEREGFIGNAIQSLRDLEEEEERYQQLLEEGLNEELRLAFNAYVAEKLSDLDDTNTAIEALYRRDMDNGERVIVIPHSQGNLFANTTIVAARAADPERNNDAIGMFGVASPAGTLIDRADYVTAFDDLVINALRDVRPILPAKLDNDPGTFNDIAIRKGLNHEFDAEYFDERLASRAVIDAGIENLARTLKYPLEETDEIAFQVEAEFINAGLPGDVGYILSVLLNNLDGSLTSSGFGEYENRTLNDTVQGFTLDCESVVEGSYVVGTTTFNDPVPGSSFDRFVMYTYNVGDDGEENSIFTRQNSFTPGSTSGSPDRYSGTGPVIRFRENVETGEIEFSLVF